MKRNCTSLLFRLFALLTFALLLPLLASAQADSTLLGTVTDSTGAVIPGAVVTIRNDQTGLTRNVMTEADGSYLAAGLPLGVYTVQASHAGFAAATVKSVTLSLDQNLRVSLSLGPAGSSTVVEVQADAVALVDTHEATLATSIEQTRIVELPLNGRDPASLLSLIPGVSSLSVPTRPGISGDVATINGTNGSGQQFLIDGLPFNATQRSDGDPLPPPDMFQEFRVLTGNYSAEYGRNSGAVVIGATRAGTNAIHGSAWEFLRNDALNTRNWFSTSIPKLRQNQFGGALGGPIVIPKIYDGHNRTFFYGGYQGTRIRENAIVSSAIPPTAAELTGQFATTIIDPTTGAPFPNNKIDPSRFDQASKRVLAILPPANHGNFYFGQASQPTNGDQWLARVDHQLLHNNTLTARVWSDHRNITYPYGGNTMSNVPYTPGLFDVKIYSGIISDTQIITPNLLNRITGGFLLRAENRGNTVQQNAVTAFGINIAPPASPFLPNLTINGRAQLQTTINGIPTKRDTVISFADALIWNHGRHEYTFGLSLEAPHFRGNPAFDNGTFVFDGSRTRSAAYAGSGSPLADFLLGLPYTFNQQTARTDDDHTQYWAGFAQDNWKVAPRLTLNLGLRYEYAQPMYNARGYHGTFIPNIQSTVRPNAPKGLLYPGDQGLPRALYYPDKNNLAPRIGFALDPFGDGKTSIRGAFGIFYQIMDLEFSNYMNSNQPFVANITLLNPSSFTNPWGPNYIGGVNDPISIFKQNQAAGNLNSFITPTSGYSINPNIRNGYVEQTNLSIQRQLPYRTAVQAAYVGTFGRKLSLTIEQNPGIYNPATPAAAVNNTRPYDPGVLQSILQFNSENNSDYNALQLSLNRQMANGLVISSTYTWSKSFDLFSSTSLGTGVSDPFNVNYDRGRSDYDRTNVFNASVVWQLPYLRTSSNPFVRTLIAGWQVSGLTQVQSGQPFSITNGQDIAHVGVAQDRPNQTGNPALPGGRSHAQQVAAWFNTAAFTTQPVGTFGNTQRNSIRGPGYVDVDTALMKDFLLVRETRIQFRVEAFNVLNHANFTNPDGKLSDAGGNYGRITSANDPRILQGALKLYF
jgi:outer membrane receptor protein involved in Fe transport